MAEGRKIRQLLSLTRGQLIRIGVGLLLLALGGSIYGPHLTHTIGTEAVINARVIPVVSPIEGFVTIAPSTVGSSVHAGMVLAEVEDPTIDRSRLQDLKSELATLVARVAALERLHRDLDDLRGSLEATRERYRKASVTRLTILLEEARAAAKAAAALARHSASHWARLAELRDTQTVSVAAFERAESDVAGAEASAKAAALAVQRTAADLAAVRSGVFVAEERNDVPYSQQRIDEISIRQAEITAQIPVLRKRTAEVRTSITVESERLARRSHARIVAPKDGIIWRPQVVKGSRIAAGGRLMSLIDCADLFIIVKLHQRYFDEIRPGDVAQVRPLDSEEAQEAHVRDLQGMGASDRADLFAAAIPTLQQNEFLATLRLDPGPNTSSSPNYCHVGRSADVRFRRKFRLVDWVESQVAELIGAISPTTAMIHPGEGDQRGHATSPPRSVPQHSARSAAANH